MAPWSVLCPSGPHAIIKMVPHKPHLLVLCHCDSNYLLLIATVYHGVLPVARCQYVSVQGLSKVLAECVFKIWFRTRVQIYSKAYAPGLTCLHHLVLLVVTALISLACIALSLSLYEHYNAKTDLCVLVIFPALCFTVSITAYVHRYWNFVLLGSDFPFPYCVTHTHSTDASRLYVGYL